MDLWIFTAGNQWELSLFSSDDRKAGVENNCSKPSKPGFQKSSNLLSSLYNVVIYIFLHYIITLA